MNIEIDSGSGFCFGVVHAIQMAENEVEKHETLYCLGEIVHNNVEVERLKAKGLIIIDHKQFNQLHNCKVLIRAHGEPPETYQIAQQNNIQLIDATCPVVLKLQNKIKEGFDSINKLNGQVLIYGKQGHAEVNGLVGQTDGKAIVVESVADLEKIDFTRPVHIFSQTTKSVEGFANITSEIRRRMIEAQGLANIHFVSNDTICRQVSHRDKQLRAFAKKHDIIVFVSGIQSSNGKVLYEICKQENQRTYFVSDIHEIEQNWFKPSDSVGICGATSTPRWLMEKIYNELHEF